MSSTESKVPQVEQYPSVCDQHMNDDGDFFAYSALLIKLMLLNIQQRKLHFGLISPIFCTKAFSKIECKRMGKRMYGIRSFAYRIPHPHAAAASRLRLPRIWNPSLTLAIR